MNMKNQLFFTLVISLLSLFLISSCKSTGTLLTGEVYYIDSENGSDEDSGLSPDQAWKSLDALQNLYFIEGTQILLKRGSLFRGPLIVRGGKQNSPIVYSAYGSGDLPVILGSIEANLIGDWTGQGSNIWLYSGTLSTDIGNIIFNDGDIIGTKKWTLAACTVPGDFYFDRPTKKLYLYGDQNPSALYADIELALREHIVPVKSQKWIVLENLELKYGGAHGFWINGSENIIIRNNTISYIGGGDLNRDGSNIRFGNAVEFWGNNSNSVVDGNIMYEIYDTGLTAQDSASNTSMSNIVFSNNIIWNCGFYSLEFWSRGNNSTISHIIFENNTCYNVGYGWGSQRPDTSGAHLMIDYTKGSISDVVFRNNIFYGTKDNNYTGFAWNNHNSWLTELTLDYNGYYINNSADRIAVFFSTRGGFVIDSEYSLAQYSTYQQDTGLDINSLFTDPLFYDAPAGNFSLINGSPCIDSGYNSGMVTGDYIRSQRPLGSGIDMGAYEQ